MEVGSVASTMALRFPSPSAGRRLPSPSAIPVRHFSIQVRLCSFPSSSLASSPVVRASEKPPHVAAYKEDLEIVTEDVEARVVSFLTPERKAFLAFLLSLGFAFGSAEAALALGPEGPLVEEFWDNMRRYGLYFLTVFTGGLYSLLQPIFSLLRNPFTAILTIAFLSGTFYLLFLLLNFMLGITTFNYDYA